MDSFSNLYRTCYNIASILCFGFLASRHVGSTSPTRDWTQASYIRWQSLNHWTSREVPAITSFPSLCFTLDHQQQNPGTKPGIQSPRSRSAQPFPTSLPTHPSSPSCYSHTDPLSALAKQGPTPARAFSLAAPSTWSAGPRIQWLTLLVDQIQVSTSNLFTGLPSHSLSHLLTELLT